MAGPRPPAGDGPGRRNGRGGSARMHVAALIKNLWRFPVLWINRFAVDPLDIIKCGMPESKKKPRRRPLFLKKTVRKS